MASEAALKAEENVYRIIVWQLNELFGRVDSDLLITADPPPSSEDIESHARLLEMALPPILVHAGIGCDVHSFPAWTLGYINGKGNEQAWIRLGNRGILKYIQGAIDFLSTQLKSRTLDEWKEDIIEPVVKHHEEMQQLFRQTGTGDDQFKAPATVEELKTMPAKPEIPIGFLGGTALREALGVHPSRHIAFFNQLTRKRKTLGDDGWHEVTDRRPNSPRYLYRADSPRIIDLAEAYKKPKTA